MATATSGRPGTGLSAGRETLTYGEGLTKEIVAQPVAPSPLPEHAEAGTDETESPPFHARTTVTQAQPVSVQARPLARRRRLPWFLLGALLGVAVLLIFYVLVARPWHLRWGTTDEEVKGQLPGDNLVAGPASQSTHAITIIASAAAVWPWLVQIGQGRGGFYSYDWLENLAGCDIHSVDAIMPQWQQLSPGDQVRLYREGSGPPPYVVASIDPERSLVLGMHPAAGDRGDPQRWSGSWSFVLRPIDGRTTRLLVRTRGEDYPGYQVVEALGFLMERQMMYGIKERAERNPHLPAPDGPPSAFR